jgi:purine-binding chemotaxis protein CheW
MADQEAPAPETRQEGEPHLGVVVGAELYGLPLSRLQEVARLTAMCRVPGSAPHVAGLVCLRGEIMCALDARAILGLPAVTQPGSRFVVALRDFEYPIGLIVDWVADIFHIDPAAVAAPPPEWREERKACVKGAASVPSGAGAAPADFARWGDSIGLLDVDALVNR